jgi:transposase
MRPPEALQGVRVIKFRDILGRYEANEFNQMGAADLLGVSERTFRRWCQRCEQDGQTGLLDRRLGKTSGRRVPTDRADEVEALYRIRYSDFTARHVHAHLVRDHQFTWGYTWTKSFLQSKGLWAYARRRGAHGRKRPRRPLPGMMRHQDGSRHEWLAGHDAMDLIVTMDDATPEIYSAFLTSEEDTASTFRGLSEVFAARRLPLSLYTDRGSHYFVTPEADGPVDRKRPTQVGRALTQLGIDHIAAYSPQARVRSERVFQTLQDRLVKELALAGLSTVEAANVFIRDVCIPAHNVRFAVKAEQEGSGFVAIAGADRARSFASTKTVRSATTTRRRSTVTGCKYRPARCGRTSSRRGKVRQYHDGTQAIFYGPRCLGRYDTAGPLLGEPSPAACPYHRAPPDVSVPPCSPASIGIGGHLTMPPLPHHRAYGSVPRRFGGLSTHQRIHGKPAIILEAFVGEGAMHRARRA